MRLDAGLLVFVVGSLAMCACQGELAPGGAERDGRSEGGAPAASSSGGSSGGGIPGSSSGACSGVPAGSSVGSGAAPVLLAQLPTASGIVVDASYAYVASYEIGPVNRVALDGSGVVELDAVSASTVAINTTGVYTVSPSGGNAPQGLVLGCAKTGCGGKYTTLATGQNNVWGVAADDVNVYWTLQTGGAGELGGVFEAPIGGGAPVLLSGAGPANQIFASGGRVFYTGSTSQSDGPQGLLSVSADGGSPRVLVEPDLDAGASVFTFAVDCTTVYFQGRETVGKVAISGGAPTTLATVHGGLGLQMAVDAENVYFIDDQGIESVPIAGGAVRTRAAGAHASGIAVDANNVYWTGFGDGTVMKLAK